MLNWMGGGGGWRLGIHVGGTFEFQFKFPTSGQILMVKSMTYLLQKKSIIRSVETVECPTGIRGSK